MHKQRQLRYDWTMIGDQRWVTRWIDILEALERFIPNQDAHWDVVKIVRSKGQLELPGQMSKKAAVATATYLVSVDEYPWISPTDIALATGVTHNELTRVANILRYKPKNRTPEQIVEQLFPKLTRDELESVKSELRMFPNQYRREEHRFVVVAAALYLALDVTVDEVAYDLLGGNVRPWRVEEAVDKVRSLGKKKTREQQLTELEDEYGSLSEELQDMALDTIRFAMLLERYQPLPEDKIEKIALQYPSDVNLQALQEAELLEWTEDGYQLVKSCFRD